MKCENKNFYRIIFVFSFIFITQLNCNTKGWSEGHSLDGFYGKPDRIIAEYKNKIQSLDPVEFFILARAYNEKKQDKSAAICFLNCAFSKYRNTGIKPYPSVIFNVFTEYHAKTEYYQDAAYELALFSFNHLDFEYAIKFAEIVKSDDLPLYREAILVKSKAFEKLKKYDEAIAQVKNALKEFPDEKQKPVLLMRVASAFYKKGDYNNALTWFVSSLKITTSGWQGATASKESYAIIKSGISTSSENLFLVAEGLIHAGEFSNGLEVLKSIQQDLFEKKVLTVEAYAGKGMIRDSDEVIAAYSSVSEEKYSLLKAKADGLWTAGRRNEAAEVLKEAVRIPQIDSKAEFQRLCSYLYFNGSHDSAAFSMLYASVFPDDENSGKMLWLAIKPLIENKQFEKAKPYLYRIIQKQPDGEYTGNARFWLYKILSDEKLSDEANKLFITMPVYNPESVYTWILMNRKKNEYSKNELRNMFIEGLKSRSIEKTVFAHSMLYLKDGNNENRLDRIDEMDSVNLNKWEKLNSLIDKPDVNSDQSDIYMMMEKYYAAGDSIGISRELNFYVSSDEDDTISQKARTERASIISWLAGKYGYYFQQITSTIDLLGSLNLHENIFLMSDEGVRRILPIGFYQKVQKSSKEFKVPESLILAVLKAESAFNQNAESGVGANGLMQLMDPTAKDIAKTLRQKTFDLFEPEDSIRFGAYYISWLSRFFKNDIRKMVAGYNAGPGNVQKWEENHSSEDMDLFTEQVPFDETRGYMLRTEKFNIQYELVLKKLK